MSQTHAFTNDLPGNWRLLGEIELPPAGSSDRFQDWLVQALRPLNLNTRLVEKILASAQAAAEDGAAGHVHMLIYAPGEVPPGSGSWGFSRVEKRGDPQAADPHAADHHGVHAIAFYLYREGA